MSQTAKMMHLSNTKLNAAGLTPEQSRALPQRTAEHDEVAVLQALTELYTSSSKEADTHAVFASQVVCTLSSGKVVVGPEAVGKTFAEIRRSQPERSVQLRLLQTPESLPFRTMCIDQLIVFHDGETREEAQSHRVGNLIVLKRRANDGLITHMTEEEGHRKATAPLAARAAAGNNFYSPTDNMVSPCTSKLNLAKKKHHQKGTPTTLFPCKNTPSLSKATSDVASHDDLDLES